MTHSLDGLMKWLRRDEWQEPFEEVLHQHLAPACAEADINLDDLPSFIDEGHFGNLWGCAFEDFLTRDLEDGRNIVDDYLKHRGWNETAANKSYMTALKSSVMSLYEVSEIERGKSFLARDLVRGGQPVRVTERTATQTLRPWDRIAARVIQDRTSTVIAGGLLAFDLETSEIVLKTIRRAMKMTRKDAQKLAKDIGIDIGDLPAEPIDKAAVLQAAAATFTTVWLSNMLQKALDPPIPEVRNSDDEELLFCTARFPLKPGVTDETIRKALAKIPALRQENDGFWNWVEAQKPSTRTKGSEAGAGLRFVTSMDDGAVVLGNVELKSRTLSLSVNSYDRAERGQALLASALSGLVGAPLTETQTLAQMMASRPKTEPKNLATGLSAEDERAIMREMLEQHYTRTLDERVPMLGNKTPREAAKTPAGRKKLVEWLKFLENSTANRPAGDPMAAYDFAWLWEELGVSDLRR